MKSRKELMTELSKEYDEKKARIRMLMEQKRNLLYEEYPELKNYDDRLKLMAADLCVKTLLSDARDGEGGADINEYKALISEREAYMLSNHIDLKLSIGYECERCKDTGVIYSESGAEYCSCFKNRYIALAYENSNLAKLFEDVSFENFELNIFDGQNRNEAGLSSKQLMTALKKMGEDFAEGVNSGDGGSLVFYGDTGTGKTYLSVCIGKRSIEKGAFVLYTTAQDMFDKLSQYAVSNDKNNSPNKTFCDFIFEEGLLIIDDLGSENFTAFKLSQLFNIINTRQIKKLKTIISTNLTPADLFSVYDKRIMSRLSKSYSFYEFFGRDLRYA